MPLGGNTAPELIGINLLFRRVHIGVFDDPSLGDEACRLKALARKIDQHTQYVKSGELLLHYPCARGFSVVFEFIAAGPASARTRQFWNARAHAIQAVGYAVRYRDMGALHAPAASATPAHTLALPPMTAKTAPKAAALGSTGEASPAAATPATPATASAPAAIPTAAPAGEALSLSRDALGRAMCALPLPGVRATSPRRSSG